MDDSLARIAHDHSRHMAAVGLLSHQFQPLGDLDARLNQAGYLRRVARENLAQARTILQAETALLNSPSHARNLLATDVTRVGVGIVRGQPPSENELYITQIFAAPALQSPPAMIGESFQAQIEGIRRQNGLQSLRLDPLFGQLAASALRNLALPFSKDALESLLADAMRELRLKGPGNLSEVAVDVQLLRDARDIRVPNRLRQGRARVLGTDVREASDSRSQPVFVMLSLIGLTD